MAATIMRQGHIRGAESYRRRTYIEGVFGNIKNPDTEDVRRSHHRLTGIAE
ncbi:MAG: hypothetical protein R2706_10110 [Acidimicrobiales bacterium]